jgi:hypothetical protein
VIVALAAAGCIGQTPEDRERDAVVDVGRHGPTHNPGAPCLLCHDFALAGTVYRRATDDTGLAGVTVTMTDDAGHVFAATSNSTGNFYVTTGGGGTAPVTGRDGAVSIPWDVVYPVHVELRSGTTRKPMRNVIHQWGSCSECHKPDPGATSAGRVFLEAP